MFTKYKAILVLYVVLIVFAIVAFPFFGKNTATFTMVRQNPNATMEKYKDVWIDRTIVEVDAVNKDYKKGDVVGTITIPKMNYYEMPIYYGSDDINNNWQITTLGHVGNWNMFGEEGRSAVGAHNYQLFSNLTDMEKGDLFIIETEDDIFVYEVTGYTIYDHTKDNWDTKAYYDSPLYSVSLITCYPIDQGIQATEDSYIVYSKMVKGTKFIKD